MTDRGAELSVFREDHRPRSLAVAGVEWSYLTGGSGDRTLLFLSGGFGHSEAAFQAIKTLELGWRVLAPSIPVIDSLASVVAGLESILDDQGASRSVIWGDGFGSLIAQRFAQERSDRVVGMVLSNAAAPTPERRTRARSQFRTFSRMPRLAARRLVPLAFRRMLAGDDPDEQYFWDAYLKDAFAPRAKEIAVNLARLSLEFHTEGTQRPWTGRTLVVEVPGGEQAPEMTAELSVLYPQADVVRIEAVPGVGSASVAFSIAEFLTGDYGGRAGDPLPEFLRPDG